MYPGPGSFEFYHYVSTAQARQEAGVQTIRRRAGRIRRRTGLYVWRSRLGRTLVRFGYWLQQPPMHEPSADALTASRP